MSLLKNVKFDQVLGYYAAGTTARKATTIIDMAGYEGCLFIYSLGTLVAAGTLVASVTGNTTEATGGTPIAATASYTVTAADAAADPNHMMVVDVYQPKGTTYRFLEAIITPATQNAVILGITAIRYNGKLKPETVEGVLAATLAVSPAAA